ncbi:hypothetical protein GOV04_02190 [Candidatus Woesearchaeota archaeon]|nr:hypothetical protein [Candidatus Woesearchaeota archaeon]
MLWSGYFFSLFLIFIGIQTARAYKSYARTPIFEAKIFEIKGWSVFWFVGGGLTTWGVIGLWFPTFQAMAYIAIVGLGVFAGIMIASRNQHRAKHKLRRQAKQNQQMEG